MATIQKIYLKDSVGAQLVDTDGADVYWAVTGADVGTGVPHASISGINMEKAAGTGKNMGAFGISGVQMIKKG